LSSRDHRAQHHQWLGCDLAGYSANAPVVVSVPRRTRRGIQGPRRRFGTRQQTWPHSTDIHPNRRAQSLRCNIVADHSAPRSPDLRPGTSFDSGGKRRRKPGDPPLRPAATGRSGFDNSARASITALELTHRQIGHLTGAQVRHTGLFSARSRPCSLLSCRGRKGQKARNRHRSVVNRQLLRHIADGQARAPSGDRPDTWRQRRSRPQKCDFPDPFGPTWC